MPDHVINAFLGCQLFFVVFIALHDWIPRGGALSTRTLFMTASCALPYGIGLAASAHYSSIRFPMWLMWWLWIGYGSAAYGMVRAWWVPYLASEPVVEVRGQAMFMRPGAFFSMSRGLGRNAVHIILQTLALLTLALLGVLTFSGRAFIR